MVEATRPRWLVLILINQSRRGAKHMTWVFDVDGTLIGSIRSGVLRPGAAELLSSLTERGIACVLWSAGGADYAERMATAHRIDSMFDGFYAKTERDADRRYRTDHLEARHGSLLFVDDAPLDLPIGSDVIGVSQFLGGNPADRVLLDLNSRLDLELQRTE